MRANFERLVLAAVTTLVGINLWTGVPLLSVWVGSQFAGSSGLSSSALLIVLVVLAVGIAAGVWALTRLSARYDKITGRPPPPRQAAPWLRSMRAERNEFAKKGRALNTPERIVVTTVVVAVILFEVWFFFFAGSSLPNSA
jgi:hypothetical protein